jgi:uncharacterized protein YecT (DUF1311 family)
MNRASWENSSRSWTRQWLARLSYIAIFLFAVPCFYAEEESAPKLPVLDVDGGKAETVAGTGSPDGRYALAWTVRPLRDADPVDWSMLEKDRGNFKETYSDDEKYFVDILVVDCLHNRSLATLKLTESWSLPGFGHEALVARWGPADQNGNRFAIVNCDRKWSPQDLILLYVDGDSVSQRSLLTSLDQVVQEYVARQNKGGHAPPDRGYTVEYSIFGLPEVGRRIGFSDANTLWLPFGAFISKSEDAPAYDGVLHLKLSHAPDGPTARIEGAPIRKVEEREAVSSDARFLDADRQLNEVYTALRARLSPAERERLKQEQRAWLNRRNETAQTASGNAQETSLENPVAIADREVLKMTQARSAELKQWLNSVK